MFIQTEATPNPATLKFLPGRAVMDEGTFEARDRGSGRAFAARQGAHAVARRHRRLLRQRLHLGDQGRRRMAASAARSARRRHRILPVRRAADRDGRRRRRDERRVLRRRRTPRPVEAIKELIETRVRPAVAGDGGDIIFKGYRDGVVYLKMKGACSGCPSSTATLRHGIENLLKHFLPDIQGGGSRSRPKRRSRTRRVWRMFYRWLFPVLWLGFIAFWIAMARGGKAVAEREAVYFAPLALPAAGDRRLSACGARCSVRPAQRPLRALEPVACAAWRGA